MITGCRADMDENRFTHVYALIAASSCCLIADKRDRSEWGVCVVYNISHANLSHDLSCL